MLLNDLKYAVRMLAKNRGFTAVAVLSFALGIGSCTTVFCWIQTVLWRPISGVRNPAELVVLCTARRGQYWDTVSYPDLKDYAELKPVFAGVIGSQITPACLTLDNRTEWIYGQIATANFFDVLGVRAQLGRTFRPEEDGKPGGHPVLVLSHGFWQRRFGGDPGVIGRAVELNRHPFTIVGVAAPGFHGTMSGLICDFWAPLTMHEEVANFGSLTARGDRWLHTQARLAPGVSRTQAQAAAETRAQALQREYPGTNEELSLAVLPLWKSPYGGQAVFLSVLSILMAVSLGVLLIVAANVASLLLARAAVRQKEMAVRLALGAGRWRLVRQLLTESLVLALPGGLLGILFASWGTDFLRAFMPNSYLPIGYAFGIDAATLGFTLVLTLATAVVFGLAPALQAARSSLQGALKEGGRGTGSASPHHWFRSTLVVAEISLALVLLVGAGLCLRGFERARRLDPGFDPRHSVVAGLRIGMSGYNETNGLVFYRELRGRLAALPGVEEVGLASWFPLGFEGGSSSSVRVDGYQPRPGEDMGSPYSIVSPRYFAAMRIPVLEGRDFTDNDTLGAPRVAIVNEEVARRFWPGQSAVGRRFRIFGDREVTVVGVVKSGKYRSLSEATRMFVYLPYLQGVWDLNLGVVLRSPAAPESLIPAIRRTVREMDPAVEVWAALPMVDFMQAAFLPQRIAAVLMALLSTVALLLAAMGIFGLMAFMVSQRTHEIGIRMALGARPAVVMGMVLRKGVVLTCIGGLVGLAGALVLGRFLSNFLYGVSSFDPATFAGVLLLLGAVSVVACLIPSHRASRIDPVIALRGE